MIHNRWGAEYVEIAEGAINLAKKHIDLTPKKKKTFDVTLTEDEIDDLQTSCYAQIQEFCCSDEEEKPFKLLIEKLKTVKGDN